MTSRFLPFEPRSSHALWAVLPILPSDYTEYGGDVERWATNEPYPDCSCGCKWFGLLDEEVHGGADFGVCLNPKSPRAGMLTWEHQAGYGCYEHDGDNNDE